MIATSEALGHDEAPRVLTSGRRRYEIVRKLGSGGMAEVFLCTMHAGEGFSRSVALKLIREDFASRKSFCQQFAQEARFASMLTHPNIVNVFDFEYDATDRPFLTMEYVDGVDLHALTSDGEVPPSIAIHLAEGILSGLGYAHALPLGGDLRGIVHRDVSPQNVLLSWVGAIKVADFGIAKALTTSGVLSGFKGKAAYMSPEQAAGDPIDHRSDLFSLGVVLWEMLTGQRLFQGRQPMEVISRIQLGSIAPPSRLRPVSADLEAVVMKLLAKDRTARYATAREAVAALVACSDAPKDGPGELVAYLAKRFPSRQVPARRAMKSTTSSNAPGPVTNTDAETDHGADDPAEAAAGHRALAAPLAAARLAPAPPPEREPITSALPIAPTPSAEPAREALLAAPPRPRSITPIQLALAVAAGVALVAAALLAAMAGT